MTLFKFALEKQQPDGRGGAFPWDALLGTFGIYLSIQYVKDAETARVSHRETSVVIRAMFTGLIGPYAYGSSSQPLVLREESGSASL